MPKYVLEIAAGDVPGMTGNEAATFAPLGKERLRGRWNASKVAHRDKQRGNVGALQRELSQIESIPGLFLALDTDKMEAARFDPLRETEDGKKLWARITAIYRKHLSNEPRLLEPQFIRNMSADDVKTWAWCLRELVDCHLAQYATGSERLPDKDTIAQTWPGKRMRDPGNTLISETDMKRFGLPKWVDSVPLDSQAKPRGRTKPEPAEATA